MPTSTRRQRGTEGVWSGLLRADRSRRSKEIDRERPYGKGEIESILLLTLLTIFLLKPLDPSSGIQEFLSPSEERMTVGTDLYMDLLLGALRFEACSTGAFDHGIINFGMNLLLHLQDLHLLFYPFLMNFQPLLK